MAHVLHSQWSTSTVDWDDFYTSLGTASKLKSARSHTSQECYASDREDSGASRTPSTGSTTGMVDLVLDDVYNVICELYREEIIPTLHEIRRKLQRNHSALVDAQWLLKICSNDTRRRFTVINLNGTDERQISSDVQRIWAITLADRPTAHRAMPPMDPRDLTHVFQCSIRLLSTTSYRGTDQCWLSATSGNKQRITRIGGRYLFAEYLRKVGPKHFRTQPLGRLMRLVQAALDAKILVYQDNSIVPAVASSTAAKLLIDRLDKINSSTATLKRLYMNHMRKNIITLLRDKPTPLKTSPGRSRKGPRGGMVLKLNFSGESISLCKLPSLYRKKFKEDLDYEAGGYMKLADFIRAEIPECTVEGCDVERSHGQTPKYIKNVNEAVKEFFYMPSTTLLFPLAMSTSRFGEKATQCLLSNW